MMDITLTATDQVPIALRRDRVVDCTISTGSHGDERMDVRYRLRLGEALARYGAVSAGGELALTAAGARVWRGRLEDPQLTGAGLRLTAYGHWRALSDIPYTGLFSTRAYSDWAVLDSPAVSDNRPGRYWFQVNADGLIIAPQKNATMEAGALGRLGFAAPNAGARPLVTVTFDFAYNLAAGWEVGLQAWTVPASGAWSFVSNAWITTAAGPGLVTGSVSVPALTGSPTGLAFFLRYNGAPTVYGNETGDFYLQITNMRITTVAGGVTTGDLIAGGMLGAVVTANPGALSASTGLLQNPGIDLRDQRYADASIGAAIDQIAAYGTAAGQRMEAGVQGRSLYLRPQGWNGRSWEATITDLEITPTLDQLANSVYTVYQDADGRPLRTTPAVDAVSVARYGLTRRATVSSDTTSAAEAASVATVALNDRATPQPQAAIAIRALRTSSGARAPGWAVRSGDTITVRDLPPTVPEVVDRIRTFRVLETEFDVLTGAVAVVPESPLPLLEFLLARAQIGA